MRGFTLIEFIIVITIVGIIAGIVGFVLLGAVDAWSFKINRSDILWDSRLAMNRMVRETREVRNLTSVITATSSQFRFIDVDNADITYSATGTDLERTKDGSTALLAADVSSLVFTYYNASGTTIATPIVGPSSTNIRRVRINLTLTKNGQDVYIQSESVPRNF